jgi:flagellar basal-body rod modification protein FlgD
MSDISATQSATSGASGTSGTSSSDASSGAAASAFSNPQLFLQLLVAELQNQDPTNPTNPSTIMQQTAELSQVEAVNTMTTAISGEESASQDNEASGLIGKTITGVANGTSITGAVSEVQLSSSGAPTLLVNGTSVPLASITDIIDAAAPTSSGTTST